MLHSPLNCDHNESERVELSLAATFFCSDSWMYSISKPVIFTVIGHAPTYTWTGTDASNSAAIYTHFTNYGEILPVCYNLEALSEPQAFQVRSPERPGGRTIYTELCNKTYRPHFVFSGERTDNCSLGKLLEAYRTKNAFLSRTQKLHFPYRLRKPLFLSVCSWHPRQRRKK